MHSPDPPVMPGLQRSPSATLSSPTVAASTSNDRNTLPIYIPPPLPTYPTDNAFSLHVDTFSRADRWNTLALYPYAADLSSSPSYTSKIRRRHYSVGSYYDNKTTTVTLHPVHPFYLLGSAPVSPLSRPIVTATTTTTSDAHYLRRHHSPVSYNNASFSALRRITPFFDPYAYGGNSDYQRSSTWYRDDHHYETIPPVEPAVSVRTRSPSARTKVNHALRSLL